jgi:hypothetical protein
VICQGVKAWFVNHKIKMTSNQLDQVIKTVDWNDQNSNHYNKPNKEIITTNHTMTRWHTTTKNHNEETITTKTKPNHKILKRISLIRMKRSGECGSNHQSRTHDARMSVLQNSDRSVMATCLVPFRSGLAHHTHNEHEHEHEPKNKHKIKTTTQKSNSTQAP